MVCIVCARWRVREGQPVRSRCQGESPGPAVCEDERLRLVLREAEARASLLEQEWEAHVTMWQARVDSGER